MGLIASDPGGGQDFEPLAEGMHHAICIGIWDLGTQTMEKYGKPSEIALVHKVLLMWETPEERIEIEDNDLPRAISKQYTLSLHKKAALRKDLESWRGKRFTEEELEGFNLEKLLGVNCTLQVLHNKKNDKTYANVVSIVPLMKHMEKLKPENKIKFFSFTDHTNLPEGTPDWIADIIKSAEEWGGNGSQQGSYPENEEPPLEEDDIPF